MIQSITNKYHEGERLMGEIILHTPTPKGDGGLSTIVYGSRGSGKTALLLRMAQKISYIDAETNEKKRETVIWRGSVVDHWVSLPSEYTTLFIHNDDINTIKFKCGNGEDIPREQMPPIVTYTSCEDLYLKLKPHEYNIVYEPTTYQLTNSIKNIVRAYKSSREDIFEDVDVPPVVFWFEMLEWLIHNKKPEPITIVFDDVDEVFPVSPAGMRWYLNLWTKEHFMNFRKGNISFLMSTHGFQDIDGRVLVKIQYKIYTKGSTTPMISLIDRLAPILLDRGVYYIEKDAVGLYSIAKKERPPVNEVIVIMGASGS